MIGQTLAHFRITAKLGEGGMGEVYRAEDTTLNRDVAIKILPGDLAQDPERLARFEREAQVLASLNHPNIAAIYQIERDAIPTRDTETRGHDPARGHEAKGTRNKYMSPSLRSSDRVPETAGHVPETPISFLVMELVEGETLADRIAHGGLEVEGAVGLAKQMAAALEYAHDRGVVHRDFKPLNINVTPEGQVKVLDFGLAKALAPAGVSEEGHVAGAGPHVSQSPTLTQGFSRAGVLYGTAAYMSPEQARGQEVDRRTDIWAFGCVLYEMLTRGKAFPGETVTDILVSILEREPDWEALPAATPVSIRRLLSRCFAKDPSLRLKDIGDARFELEPHSLDPHGDEQAVGAVGSAVAASASKARSGWLGGLLAGMALAGVASGAWIWATRPAPSEDTKSVSRWAVQLEEPRELITIGRSNPLAISPGGSRLVFAVDDEGVPKLFLRDLDKLENVELPGTDGARNPFFSPDERWVGFFSANRLYKVAVEGGAPQLVSENSLDDMGASWGTDNTIVFALYGTGLSRVAADGGQPEAITTLEHEAGEIQHRWPQILPGGRDVLFTSATDKGSRVGLVSLDTGKRSVVSGLGDVLRAVYLPSGVLVYAQAGGLMAVRFDVQEAQPLGDPVLVLKGLASVPDQGNAYFALADNATLAYLPGTPSGNLELVWVDRQGQAESAVDDLQGYGYPQLTPQDNQLVVTVGSEIGIRALWIYDLQRGSRAVLSMEGSASNAALSPDGERVYFSSNLTGSWNLYHAPLDASSPPQMLLDRENEQWAGSWSPDGQAFAFYDVRPESGRDIYVLSAGQTEPEPFIVTPFNERAPRFSPDSRWLAYVSNESGRDEVYVESFPVRGRKWTISSNGGAEPRWSRDGSELFYRQGNQMLAVDVESGDSFSASRPHVLFEGHFDSSVAGNPNYDVSSDGERFLMIRRSGEAVPNTINVVLNWSEDLELEVGAEE